MLVILLFFGFNSYALDFDKEIARQEVTTVVVIESLDKSHLESENDKLDKKVADNDVKVELIADKKPSRKHN